MHSFANIVVFHPAAIGDAVLATPVAATLKLNFPGAKLTYWSHGSLRPLLLELCPAVDDFVDYVRDASLFEQMKTFDSLKADLFIDLSNSGKSKAMTWLSKVKVLRYEKQDYGERPIKHAVVNFLETLKPICKEYPDPIFPTLFPEALISDLVDRVMGQSDLERWPMIGVVPGVGRLRPHRAWISDGWRYLIDHIWSWQTHLPVLIGGEDEAESCAALESDIEGRCLNLAGKLALTETAAMLRNCVVIVSGDTGPAHIGVAVGRKVIGLYGPTFPERSGPFGCRDLVLDQSRNCQCHNQKKCNFVLPTDAGECMNRIMLPEIIDRLKLVLSVPVEDEARRSQ